MKNLITLALLLAAYTLQGQAQVTPDFSAECPCALGQESAGDLTVYSCMYPRFNASYKVEVQRYPKGIPDGLTEREHLLGYYADLEQQGEKPEFITFRDALGVQYRLIEPFSASKAIISDSVVFFSGGKRYTLTVTTVSGTQRELFRKFTNAFESASR